MKDRYTLNSLYINAIQKMSVVYERSRRIYFIQKLAEIF